MERRFWFSDAQILMIFEDPELYAIVRPVLDELQQDPGVVARFSCIFETSRRLHDPVDASLVHDGFLGPGISVPGKIFAAADKEWLIVAGEGSVEVDSRARTARIRIMPGADRHAASTMALYAIDAALSATGQQLLHGAALMMPSGESAVLIFAPSGAGKTTTAIALALHGFKILTDDALVLQTNKPAPAAWGLPRSMKVHWRTVELLPVLKSVIGTTWNNEGEQVLTRRTFSELGGVASHTSLPIAAIFLLGSRSDGEHVIENTSRADVLVELANDNVGTSRLGVIPRQVQKMEAVAELLNQVPAARLQVGRSLDQLGPVIVDYCGQRRRQATRTGALSQA